MVEVKRRPYGREHFTDRNLADGFWNKINHDQRVASQFAKSARTARVFVQAVATMLVPTQLAVLAPAA